MATLPNPNPIPNAGFLEYSYSVDPSLPDISKSILSNTVYSQVNIADLNITKAGSTGYAKKGDVIEYIFTINNSGNVAANSIIFKDTIASGLSYVGGTLKINSVVTSGDPSVGISLSNIAVNGITTIQFNVLVNTVPVNNPINNDGVISYGFIYDPSTPSSTTSAKISNIVPITVVEAVISNADGGLIKTVDKAYVTKGETVTYIVKVKNTGNTLASNVIFKDTIPTVTSLVANSIKLNGGSIIGNLSTGINIGTLNSGETKSIEFKVVVNTVPSPNLFQNDAVINYNYTLFPTIPDGQGAAAISNLVDTRVNYAEITEAGGGLTKTVDKSEATLGDTLTYTITLINKGNTNSNNVIFKDTIPSYTSFIGGSVYVNGVNRPSDNPQSGVNIGTMVPNTPVVITFKVIVTTIPSTRKVDNQGRVEYSYTVDPSLPNGNTQVQASTIVSTTISYAEISTNNGGLVKTSDVDYVEVGQNVTYTIVLKNTGNVGANNVIVYDTIPIETTLVPGSVKVNNSVVGDTPNTGINIGTVLPNEVVTINFTVVVNTLPVGNILKNSADVGYNFPVEGIDRAYRNKSNEDLVNVVYAETEVKKIADVQYADIGSDITYTLEVKNIGNTTISNVILIDTIPEGTSFVNGSVKINNIANATANPELGINLGSILANEIKTVTFKVKVTTIPVNNPIQNIAGIDYKYKVDPTGPDKSKTGIGTSGGTEVKNANFEESKGGFTKSVDLQYAKIGDQIQYTLVVKNLGNVDATNVVIIDTVPQNTTYVNNTVLVNGVSNSGNPNTGINVGTISPNAIVTIVFKVLVISTLPNDNTPNTATMTFDYEVDPNQPDKKGGENSNTTTTKINSAVIDGNNGGIIKAVDKVYVTKGEIVTYTVTIKNTGNVVATNVVVKDTIPDATSFIQNSVKIDGITQPSVDITNPLGNNIGDINPGQTKVLEFKVKVDTVPDPNTLINDARVTYLFTKNPLNPNGEIGNSISNQVISYVNYGSFNEKEGGNTKLVDKKEATVGDIITYTIVLKNVGNIQTTSTVFKDTIPTGTTFVNSSVNLNGLVLSTANPQVGINLGTVMPGQVNTIVFKVMVNSIPLPAFTENQGRVEYKFTVDPAKPGGNTGVDLTTVVKTEFKYAQIDKNTGGLSKISDYQNVELGGILRYTIKIKNTGNIDAKNVIVKDILAPEVSYIAGSLTLNGVQSSGNIVTGVNVGTIVPNGTMDVGFSVLVNSLPQSGKIENKATVDYTFTVDGVDKTVTSETNILTNSVVQGKISIIKFADKQYADVNEEITYTAIVKNEGNVIVNPVILKDTIPAGTTFVLDSVKVNGAGAPGANITIGYNLGSINVNEVKTVTFKVLVVSIPTTNPIKNLILGEYTYVVDPSIPSKTLGVGTESGETKINNANFNKANLGFTKGVSKGFVTIGDEIEYTLTLTNLGNVEATNVIVKDTLPANVEFINGSVLVNGIATTGNIQNGILVNNVLPNESKVISFKVKVISILPTSIINNIATVNYKYVVDPNKPPVNKEESSTNAVSKIKVADLEIVKVPNSNTAYLGNVIEYTIKVTNKGNVDAENVVIKDSISKEASFIENSLSIDGNIVIGANIVNGITIDRVKPEESKIIKFKVKFIDIPRGSMFKNVATGSYQFIVNPNEGPISKEVNSNTSTVVVSIYIDENKEVPIGNCPNTMPNLMSKRDVYSIRQDTKCGKIKYTVDGICTPTDKACVGESIRKYKMWKQKSVETEYNLGDSDIDEIESLKAELLFIRNERVKTPTTGTETNVEGEKLTGEKEIVETVIKFTLRVITGTGEILKYEIVDAFSAFIVIENSYLGFNLTPKGCVEDIEITSLCNGVLRLSSLVLIYLTPESTDGCGIQCSNEIDSKYISISNLCPNINEFIELGQNLWKEFDVESRLNYEGCKIGEIVSVNGTVDVINYRIIRTPISINENNEGLGLTGRKILVNMILTIKLNYMESYESGIIKRKNIIVPVGTYIVMETEENSCATASFNIKACIEDIFVYNFECDYIFSNTTIVIKAVPCIKKPLC